MPNPYNPNPYNEDQDRARQQPLYDQPGGPRQDASQEYHKGDGVFQIPWWVIVITFCFAAWPIGVAMMIINHLLRKMCIRDRCVLGNLDSFSGHKSWGGLCVLFENLSV